MLVFVYGTLTDPETAGSVLESYAFEGAATLDGLHRVDGAYPTLVPGGDVQGRLLSTDELDRLDDYEGVDRGLYVRVGVPVTGWDRDAAVYVGDPARLDAPGEWPGEGSFADRVRSFVDAHDVVVRPDDDR